MNEYRLNFEKLIEYRRYVFYSTIVVIIIIIHLFWLSGCNTNIGRKLSENELIGEWKITEDSVEFLQKNNICCSNKETKLALSDDGKFNLTNMPSCWMNDFGSCGSRTFDFEGTWSIDKTENNSNTMLLKGLTVRGVSLIKKNGKVQMVFDFGDPDSGRGIYLSK